jgi:hypothetical protein
LNALLVEKEWEKKQIMKEQSNAIQQEHDEKLKRKAQEESEDLLKKEWEESREKRVDSWKKFCGKKKLYKPPSRVEPPSRTNPRPPYRGMD